MLRILHTSDLHGKHKPLLSVDPSTFDVWVDTGDFFPTAGRHKGIGFRIHPPAEVSHQGRWVGCKMLGSRLTEWLDGRPAIICSGNHDFISLHAVLRGSGADAHQVTPEGFDLLGHRWAGFREIPFIIGEWAGECHDFSPFLERLDPSADILVTHAPPGGILSEEWGIGSLTQHLAYKPHNVKLHLFGHVHGCGGQEREEMGIRFVNSACGIKHVHF